MRYNNRAEVERIGKAGVFSYKEDGDVVARQMSSYWIYVDPADRGYTPHALNDGFWEAWVTLWMSRNVRPGSVCVDVGANFGFYTFFLAQHGCTVYGFDPNPLCIRLLDKSNELNATTERVTIENYAVTDGKQKEIKLWNVAEHTMNTTIKENPGQLENFFVARTLTLDSYFAKKKDGKKIDLIKIDAEGSEEMIWNGMQKLLKKNPQCLVLMEFVPDHYKDMGKPFLTELMKHREVSFVDYTGVERKIRDHRFFDSDKEPFRMLVLRAKE